jgi:hypothetical protein
MTDLRKEPENHEIILTLSEKVYKNLLKHLLPSKGKLEESAFLFVDVTIDKSEVEFIYRDSYYVLEKDYVFRSGFHLELKDSVRAMLIKKAHELNCCIVESHSHIDQEIAEFSYSDWIGFDDFVPHIQWRLKGKPYISLVFTRRNFDALVWFKDKQTPIALKGIRVGNKLKVPTGKSIKNKYYEE